MSERKYEHTVDLDHVVSHAAEYEKIITEADALVSATENEEAIKIANLAADALGLQQQMFYHLLPEDLREEFWDKLELAVNQPAGA